jgi:CheY-like chemotaxis protein
MTVADKSSWRVLVMEDDGLIAMHLCDILDELGYVVVGPIRTVEDALAAIENQPVDMALLDVNLGNGKTSYPVADKLACLGVPFAFSTGYGEKSLDKRFFDQRVISKPVTDANLRKLLRELQG